MKDRRGFTLIEIIAVVIIIGIIALIVVPSVSGYISGTRNSTYEAHEKAMTEAAKSMAIEVINGKDTFALPKKGDHSEVFLNELIDKEYIAQLKDPSTGEACNESMSYVIITGITSSSYGYKACLYCGKYITDSPECAGSTVEDNNPPTCGIVTGASTEWTKESRTITVACSDVGSGCIRSKFSKTFNSTTKEGKIQISDKSGKTAECEVNAYVDKTAPTCELEAVGDGNVESTGWSSGRNVVVRYKANSRQDEHSKVATYGIGTSIKNRDYNKQDSYEINNISGTTTVIGYVKDNAGNEGVCSKTVTTGLEKPEFEVRYGYQIYPKKERFDLSGANQVGDNQIETTSSTPIITFKNMNKYQGVTAVIMEFNAKITDPSSFKLTIDGTTYSAASDNASGTRLRFYIETEPLYHSVSSKSEYQIQLGKVSGKTYTITRIEAELKNGNMSSRDNVSVNLITRKTVVKTTKWSWDDGTHWENQYYKQIDVSSGAKTGYAKVKNDIPLTSEHVEYSVGSGDPVGATVTITSGNTNWTNQDVVLTGKATDIGTGIIGYIWNTTGNVDYYDENWEYFDTPQTGEQTFNHTVTKNGTYYLHVKDEAGNVTENSITVTNIDRKVPTCSAITGNGNQAILSCSDPAGDSDNGQSKIVAYYFGTKSGPVASDYTAVTDNASYSETKTVSSAGTYYIFVKDQAGNVSAAKSDKYIAITYNGGGATAAGTTSGVVRLKSTSLTAITRPEKKPTVSFDLNSSGATATTTALTATYTFNGWYTANKNGSLVASNAATPALQASVEGYTNSDKQWTKESATTLYAQWTSDSVTLPAITKTGHDCKWNTKTDGTGTNYKGGASYTPTANITLYAYCVYAKYKVTFNKNGGTTAGTASVNVTYLDTTLSTITLPERKYSVSFNLNSTSATATTTDLTATYTFTGWATAASDGTKIASNSTTPALEANVTDYTNASSQWIKTSATTIYAQWTSGSVTLPKITKTGHTCVWNTKSNGKGTDYAGETAYTPTAATTLYAKCTPNNYTLTVKGKLDGTERANFKDPKFNTNFAKFTVKVNNKAVASNVTSFSQGVPYGATYTITPSGYANDYYYVNKNAITGTMGLDGKTETLSFETGVYKALAALGYGDKSTIQWRGSMKDIIELKVGASFNIQYHCDRTHFQVGIGFKDNSWNQLDTDAYGYKNNGRGLFEWVDPDYISNGTWTFGLKAKKVGYQVFTVCCTNTPISNLHPTNFAQRRFLLVVVP